MNRFRTGTVIDERIPGGLIFRRGLGQTILFLIAYLPIMERERKIKFEIPYHIGIPKEVTFFPQIQNVPVGVEFETVNKGNLNVGGSSTIRRERFGNAISSNVTVRFHGKFEQIFSSNIPDKGVYPGGRWFPDKDGLYIKFAVDALNQVISAYRHVTGSYWINMLNMGDIAEFIIEDYKNGKIVNSTDRQITRGSVRMGRDLEDDVEKIGDILSDEEQINMYQEIHLNIRDELDLGEYTLSAMLSFMLFERWVKNAFLLSISEIKSQEKAEDLAFEDDGQFESIMTIIDFFRDHADLEFKDFRDYDKWKRELYELRNEIVHELYRPTFDEAGVAHELCVDSIEWFQSKLDRYLVGHQESVQFANLRDFRELDPLNMYRNE